MNLNKPPKYALKAWTKTINEWYNLEATIYDMRVSFNKLLVEGGTDYIEDFFIKKDGTWATDLDTADREILADNVSIIRGWGNLPTYGDVRSGNLSPYWKEHYENNIND